MTQRKYESVIDSMEFKLFDKNGKSIFKFNRAPKNIGNAKRLLDLKGIKL